MHRINLRGRKREGRNENEKVGRLGIAEWRHVLSAAAQFRLAADEKERDVAAERSSNRREILAGESGVPELRKERERPSGVRAASSQTRARRDLLVEPDRRVRGPAEVIRESTPRADDEVGFVAGNRKPAAREREISISRLDLDSVGEIDRDDPGTDLVIAVGADPLSAPG